jgi:hypothetical protein
MSKKIAAINSNDDFHLLDHIAPLAQILNIPLIIQNKDNLILTKKYYPKVNTILNEEMRIDYLAKNFDFLIENKFWLEDQKEIFKYFNKNIKLFFAPHGNSDKGHINKNLMTFYKKQDGVFLYGNHMIEFLKHQKVFNDLNSFAISSNYRLSFYLNNKKFYDDLIEKDIFSKLNKNNKTIFYAPTWKDSENSTSFFLVFEKLIKNFSKNFNLIIKPHPLLEKREVVLFYQTLKKDFCENIIFLDNYPLIYPILNRVDIYLGDFSSIGYDFLYFQKPMFFLDIHEKKINKRAYNLYKCGICIDKKNWDNIFSFIEKNISDSFKKIQREMFEYAFGKILKISEIKNNLLKIF